MANITAGSYCFQCHSHSCMHMMMQAQEAAVHSDLMRHYARIAGLSSTGAIESQQFSITGGSMTLVDDLSDEKKLLLLL